MTTKLLQLRKSIKAKKPFYTRQENKKKKKMDDDKWRRPRGLHSKMRLRIRGKKRSPEPGFGSPREVEGLHPSGLRAVMVYSLADVDKLQGHQGAMIGSGVGMRKKAAMVEHCHKKNIRVLNIKDAQNYIEEVAQEMKARKDAAKKSKVSAVVDEKKEAKEPKESKSDKKETKEIKKEEKVAEHTHPSPEHKTHAHSDEEQKKKDKEEKDKVLTKRV